MSTSRGMVQVLGITYRIIVSADVHHIVRILDDRLVGAFRVRSGLKVVSSDFDFDTLMRVAQTAARTGKVDWPAAEPGSRTPDAKSALRLGLWRSLCSLSWQRGQKAFGTRFADQARNELAHERGAAASAISRRQGALHRNRGRRLVADPGLGRLRRDDRRHANGRRVAGGVRAARDGTGRRRRASPAALGVAQLAVGRSPRPRLNRGSTADRAPSRRSPSEPRP